MSKPRLQRSLGVIDTTGIALGAIIGAGIFVTIGEAAAAGGAAFLLVLPIGAAIATFSGLSAVELGIKYPKSGGAYVFGRETISPAVGFIAGWIYLFAGITANATFALAFSGYLKNLAPGISLQLSTIILVLFATVFSYFGIRLSSTVNFLLVIAKIAILLGFIILGIHAIRVANFYPFNVKNISGLLRATALMFFAYAGFARPITLAEEIKGPRLTLPKALVSALFIASALYFATALVAVGTAGVGGLAKSQAPLSFAAGMFSAKAGIIIISIGAFTAIASVLLTEILALSRVIFAMARNGDLPGWLAALHPKYKVPQRAVVLVGIAVILPALYATLGSVIAASSFAILIYYGLINLSAIRLSQSDRIYGLYVSIAGLIANLVIAFTLPAKIIVVNIIMIAVGFIYYFAKQFITHS